MRSHAKASTAGSNSGWATGLSRISLIVFAALLALMIAAIPANAAEVHQLTSSFGASGSGSGQFSANNGIAVDQFDGSVYVVDSGNFRVQKFDAAGNFVLTFGKGVNQTNPGDVCTAASTDTCGAGTEGSGGTGFDTNGGFSNPTFVAVDSISGDVYVADSGTSVIDKFSSTGAFLSSNDGSGSGSSFASFAGIAVDSSTHLWVYDTGSQMREFDAAGSFVSQWEVPFVANPVGIAVDSASNLYVVRGFPKVQKFNSTGVNLGELDSSGTATSLSADPATGDIYVGAGSEVKRFAAECALPCSPVESFGSGDIASATGIAVRGFNGAVYVSDPAKPAVDVFGLVTVPTATTGSATGIEPTSATLNGKVNPVEQTLTDCHFDIVPASQFEVDKYQSVTPAQQAPCVPAASSIPVDSSDHVVSADLSDLDLGATYHFRLVVASAQGASSGADRTFTTASSPLIGAQSVEAVGTSDATLSAQINPQGAKTTYHVEYGTTASYGQSTAESAPVGFETDSSDHTVSVHIGGLAPGTAYHFRFVATNDAGVTEGSDLTFATYPGPPTFGPCSNEAFRSGFGAGLPDCRAYEQATPIDKHGADAQGSPNLIQASSAGDRITFYVYGGLPTTGGSATLPPFMAARGSAGWSFDGLLPATAPAQNARVMGWSDDLSTTLTAAGASAVADAAFYLRDSATATFELGPTSPVTLQEAALAGFAADTSHMIVETNAHLAPGAVPGNYNLYDIDHGVVTLPGRIPAGSATNCDDIDGPACEPAPDGAFAGPYDLYEFGPGFGGAHLYYYTQNTISPDGSRIFFTTRNAAQLYVREDGSRTTRISASQRSVPDPNGEKPAAFMAATPDGSKVLFTSCEKLTDDSTAFSNGEHSCSSREFGESLQGQDLYSYDVDSGELTDLTVDTNGDEKGAAVQGVLGASEDGSYVYFAANGVLAPGASPGNCEIRGLGGRSCNLYLSHDGDITFIATLSGSNSSSDAMNWKSTFFFEARNQKNSRVSADGRTLLFSSRQSLTGYDNTEATAGACSLPCSELFRYTASDDELACVSCNPTGVRPTGDARFGTPRGELLPTPNTRFLSRNLSADGDRVFFESSDALLPTDTNGVTDVYEWEAEGSGACAAAGGCIYLVSSGASPDPSYFGDASANGDHVFFFSSQQLVPSDRDQLVDVYDAGVGAGLASQHTLAPPTCAGAACQANPAPPPDPPTSSATFSGPGNAKKLPAARKCPKGKRKVRRAGKVHCQKAHKQHKRNTNRGGSK